MNKIPEIMTNTILAGVLIVLILGPVGFVGYVSGMAPKLDLGTFLGASINSKGEVLQKISEGITKKIAVKTFWGQKATYQRAIHLQNTTNNPRTYQLEIIKVEGDHLKEQTITAYFSKNHREEITLNPGESSWIDIVVSAERPPAVTKESSKTQITLAIWDL